MVSEKHKSLTFPSWNSKWIGGPQHGDRSDMSLVSAVDTDSE